MKTLFFCLLSIAAVLPGRAQSEAGQPLDVMLIGTAHNYGKTLVEHFDYPLNKALAFRPDAVFGEYMSAEDYDAVPDYWNKANTEKRVAYVKSHPFADPKQPDAFIQQTYQRLRQRPNQHGERIKLARALYLKHDFGNAAYQLYRLDQGKSQLSSEDRATYQALLGEPDSLYRSRSSEYHNLIFPLIDKLGQDRILPMDSQQYDLQWQAAWDSVVVKTERAVEAEKDTNSANYRVWTSFLNWQTKFYAADKQAQAAGETTRYYNTDAFSARVDSVNLGGDLLLKNLRGYPTAEAARMRHVWQLRNEAMCRNLVRRARAVQARRVVVGVGSAHRKTMLDILRTMPGVKVYTLNEYQP